MTVSRPRLVSALLLGALALSLACSGDPKPTAASPDGTDKAAPAAETAKPDEDGSLADKAAQAKADAQAAGEKVKVVEGTAAGGDERYDLLVQPPADAKAGQEGAVTVKVVPKQPWHMNLDFPTSLKMQAPEGVTLVNAEQKKADAVKLDEENCEFAVKFTPSAAGEQSFTGKFKFAVCQDEACAPVTEELEFKVAVK
jgi:hypothetical protein